MGAALLFTLGACALFGGGEVGLTRARGYRLTAPSSWKEKSTGGESDKAYRLASNNIVTVTSSCKDNAQSSLDVLTRQLLIGARNVVIEKKERHLVSGTEGQYARVRATFDGVPFVLDVFVFAKEGCVFDFSLVAPKSITPSETKEFISFVKTFEYGTD